ncbi:MAG: hypothetical protein QG673_1136, partial [Pseudomonadota bacterium]|nr:hypothetical protein [Pseudomonadota bacterium]
FLEGKKCLEDLEITGDLFKQITNLSDSSIVESQEQLVHVKKQGKFQQDAHFINCNVALVLKGIVRCGFIQTNGKTQDKLEGLISFLKFLASNGSVNANNFENKTHNVGRLSRSDLKFAKNYLKIAAEKVSENKINLDKFELCLDQFITACGNTHQHVTDQDVKNNEVFLEEIIRDVYQYKNTGRSDRVISICCSRIIKFYSTAIVEESGKLFVDVELVKNYLEKSRVIYSMIRPYIGFQDDLIKKTVKIALENKKKGDEKSAERIKEVSTLVESLKQSYKIGCDKFKKARQLYDKSYETLRNINELSNVDDIKKARQLCDESYETLRNINELSNIDDIKKARQLCDESYETLRDINELSNVDDIECYRLFIENMRSNLLDLMSGRVFQQVETINKLMTNVKRDLDIQSDLLENLNVNAKSRDQFGNMLQQLLDSLNCCLHQVSCMPV